MEGINNEKHSRDYTLQLTLLQYTTTIDITIINTTTSNIIIFNTATNITTTINTISSIINTTTLKQVPNI